MKTARDFLLFRAAQRPLCLVISAFKEWAIPRSGAASPAYCVPGSEKEARELPTSRNEHPFDDHKTASDFAKAQADEFSKTLALPFPFLTTLIALLLGEKDSLTIFGAELPRSWAVTLVLFVVFLLTCHCCRLLSALITVTRINQHPLVKATLRFHPGIFNPSIMAWPKSLCGISRWMAWPGIWIATLSGRIGCFFALSFPLGLASKISHDIILQNSKITTISLVFLMLSYNFVLFLAAAAIREVDSYISEDDVPKERWQSFIGVILGYVLGGILGLAVARVAY